MELLKKHFDTALESPDGVKKLRELILTLAMQGKLVEQDPTDQPANELLKEIKEEIEKLSLQSRNPLPEINIAELPFAEPKGWTWERLGNIISKMGSGSTPRGGKNVYVDKGIMFFRSQNIYNDGIRTEKISHIPMEIHEKMNSTKIHPNDILFNITGGSLGRSALVPNNFKEGNISQHVCIIRPIFLLPKFIHLTSICSYFQNYIPKALTGSGREGLQKNKMELFPIAIPPLAEQKRIVEKIDQLMALCDKLEAQRKSRDEKRLAVHTSAVNRLLAADEETDFNSSWQFITCNFNELYSVKENVAELKKAILTLAMQGKLVKQDPSDQPASELLKEIKAEKEWLIAEGKIKKQKPLPEIKPEEIPYEIPGSWEWVRLGEIGEYIQRGKGPKYSDIKKIPVISQKCIQWRGFNKDVVKFIDPNSIEKYQHERFIRQGDLLWNSTGTGTLGRINIYQDELADFETVVADSHVTVVRLLQVSKTYIPKFLMSPIVQDEIEERASGTTNQIELNTSMVQNQVVPLPPLAEQKRIVEKIDQLMAICDKLDEKIELSTKKQTALFDAVLAQV